MPTESATSTSTSASTSATLHSFTLGTGHSIFTSAVDPVLRSTENELLFVTCFWAPSTSATCLSKLLRDLSSKTLARGDGRKIRVRLGFSSRSLLQKLLHTTSLEGHVLSRQEITEGLGLPDPQGEELRGLDLQAKSVFQLPFSVMHPKFVVVDRRICVLPSCNVSWERWFEGAIVVSGPIVGEFIRFWRDFWGVDSANGQQWGFHVPRNSTSEDRQLETEALKALRPRNANGDMRLPLSIPPSSSSQAPSTLLIHPPHRNPNFRPLFLPFPKPPSTPLNDYLLRLFNDRAQSNIVISTPNLTSPPAISALKTAMMRGVHVQVYTDANVMVAEQVVTAGTTTTKQVKNLVKWHKKRETGIGEGKNPRDGAQDEQRTPLGVAEEGRASLSTKQSPGKLTIRYFSAAADGSGADQSVPEHLHFKMTAVDVNLGSEPANGETTDSSSPERSAGSTVDGREHPPSGVVVLGSGNMDRASWYTSQEIALAIDDGEAAGVIVRTAKGQLDNRTRIIYDG